MDVIRIDATKINVVFNNLTDETRIYALEEEGQVSILNHEKILEDGKEWGTPIDEETGGEWILTLEKQDSSQVINTGRDAINQMYVGDRVQFDFLTIRRIV
jgi:hypothetical protein